MAQANSAYGKLSVRQRQRNAHAAQLDTSLESYVELAFEADTSGAVVDDAQRTAAQKFDQRYLALGGDARKRLVETAVKPGDILGRAAADAQLRRIRMNRYVLPETAAAAAAAAVTSGAARRRPRKTRRPWSLHDSIWKERLVTYGDFFETVEGMSSLFRVDWDVAVRAHELGAYIVKSLREPSTWRDIDMNGCHDEVDEVHDVLFAQHRLIYGAFEYYSVAYSENELSKGEPDVWSISFTAYMHLVEQCKMLSRHTPHGEFETLFSIVNAVDQNTKDEDMHNGVRSLNRQEFLQCLVRMAITIYVRRGVITDVSDAVGRLLIGHLTPHLPPEATQNSNAFRKRFCYIEATSKVLDAHCSSLRALYEAYAAANDDQNNKLRKDDGMSVGEWLNFVQHIGLVESGQLTVARAKHVFMWSRLRSMPKRGAKAELALRHMLFLDFLEALVRLSLMLALPTDGDLEETGAADAGEFLLAMRINEPVSYTAFLTSHRPKFSDPDGSDYDEAAHQPVWRCLEHLLKLIIRTIEHATSATNDVARADGVVSDDEMTRFLKRRGEGGLALEAVAYHSAQSLGRIQFGEALESSKSRAMTTAAAIRIQMASRARKARQRVQERKQRVEDHKTRVANANT